MEGETEMKYNPQKIKPETGKLTLFPAYWTHKHRGKFTFKWTNQICYYWMD